MKVVASMKVVSVCPCDAPESFYVNSFGIWCMFRNDDADDEHPGISNRTAESLGVKFIKKLMNEEELAKR